MTGHNDHGKKGTIEQIIDELDPDKIARKVVIPHREIRNKYQIPAIVETYEDFVKQLTDYVKHHWKGVYKGSELDNNQAFGHAHMILEAVFKDKGGFKHAFTLAKEGKLDEVVNAISSNFEEEDKAKYVASIIHSKIDPTDLNQMTDIAKGVMDKYKSFLPEGYEMKDPRYYAQNYPNLLQLHQNLVGTAMQFAEKPKVGHRKSPGHGGH